MPALKINAGDLRDRIRIERRVRADSEELLWDDGTPLEFDNGDDVLWSDGGDGAGNYETTWRTLLAKVPAKIQARRGGEDVQAARLAGVSQVDIWVRLDSSTSRIRVGDRVINERDGSRIYNIRFSDTIDDKRRWVLIQCTEGDAV